MNKLPLTLDFKDTAECVEWLDSLQGNGRQYILGRIVSGNIVIKIGNNSFKAPFRGDQVEFLEE